MPTAGDARTAPCPQCGQPAVLAADNPWRPFCSERCKLLDLGGWFSGRYTLGADDPSPQDDTAEDGQLQ